MYLTNLITRPLYQYMYRFVICESRFGCSIVFHRTIIKQEHEKYDYYRCRS
jgi:hypothetical protein